MSRGRRSSKDPYKSQLERDVATKLHGVAFEYESMRIPYLKKHSYTPDFILPNGVIIEVKGRFTAFDRAKHLLIQKQQPDLDIRFVFATDNKINRRSKTRYSDWCEKHNFLYAFDRVPSKWIQEKRKCTTALDADTLLNKNN